MRMFDRKSNSVSRSSADHPGTTSFPARPGPAVGDVPARAAAGSRRTHDFSAVPIHAGDANSTGQIKDAVAPPSVQRVLASPGEPLIPAEADRMRAVLGRSFADVRVHRDTVAADSADEVGAGAYTVGSHIVFGRGHGPGSSRYAPTLAHELIHVMQQRRSGGVIGAVPLAAPSSSHEHEAGSAARLLMGGGVIARPSAAPLQLSRQPRLTIVDAGSGLTDKELAVIVVHADKSLAKTTVHAQDKRVKKGVTISYQRGLTGVESMVKRGDVMVYVIGAGPGKKHIPPDRMKVIVRDIVAAQGIVPKDQVDARSRSLADDLREDVNPDTGEVTGRHEYSPRTSVSIVNVDLYPKRGKANLRAIAGDILHESVGHRAMPREYHNPQGKGVMAEHVRESATEEQILFQSDEWDAVNEFLKSIVEDPTWNK